MVPRTAYPPTHHHTSLTTPLSPTAAQSTLARFLEKTSTSPHLHPDSLLSTPGITYSAHSGPSGGLAIHHLKRIEAGLRGENLVAETDEELKRLTGDGVVEGDDEALDESIARTERRVGRKRKRVEEIQDWAEETSSQAEGGVVVPPGREIESFAHTPLHQSDYDQQGQMDMQNNDWQDQTSYELQQRPLEGELGEREGAPVQRQNLSRVPKVVETNGTGAGDGQKELTAEERKARKAAKKARQDERRAKGRAGS